MVIGAVLAPNAVAPGTDAFVNRDINCSTWAFLAASLFGFLPMLEKPAYRTTYKKGSKQN